MHKTKYFYRKTIFDIYNNFEYFIKVLDDALKVANSDYEAKRFNDYVMKLPIVHKAPKGTFYQWLKLNHKLGGQFKVPRLSNERKYFEDILPLIK